MSVTRPITPFNFAQTQLKTYSFETFSLEVT